MVGGGGEGQKAYFKRAQGIYYMKTESLLFSEKGRHCGKGKKHILKGLKDFTI